jgi:hypothetical protein
MMVMSMIIDDLVMMEDEHRSARLGSARLGSARLGSARLGSARLGSARLGSARARARALWRTDTVRGDGVADNTVARRSC